MAHKSSFDQEAKKKAIDKAMPEEETGIVQKIKRNVPIALESLLGGEEAAYEQWKKGRAKAPSYDLYKRTGEVGAESAVSEKKASDAAYDKYMADREEAEYEASPQGREERFYHDRAERRRKADDMSLE
tara:strand:+ start:1104 stop:1490 length:387 start_codon:yes stop_codon:yes gene_type:complete